MPPDPTLPRGFVGRSVWLNCGCGATSDVEPGWTLSAWGKRVGWVNLRSRGWTCPRCLGTPGGERATIFECRTCAATVDGWSDGAVAKSGWHRIENIDGPNFMCPKCLEDEAIEDLLDEYRSAYVGGPVGVRDGE